MNSPSWSFCTPPTLIKSDTLSYQNNRQKTINKAKVESTSSNNPTKNVTGTEAYVRIPHCQQFHRERKQHYAGETRSSSPEASAKELDHHYMQYLLGYEDPRQ
jgi:hypothetical protein